MEYPWCPRRFLRHHAGKFRFVDAKGTGVAEYVIDLAGGRGSELGFFYAQSCPTDPKTERYKNPSRVLS